VDARLVRRRPHLARADAAAQLGLPVAVDARDEHVLGAQGRDDARRHPHQRAGRAGPRPIVYASPDGINWLYLGSIVDGEPASPYYPGGSPFAAAPHFYPAPGGAAATDG
jgi:hypothetical protein